MKKLAAILLSGILLFNWLGYRLLTTWLENRADSRLEAQLDANQYDESQLISFKIPLTHLSYWTNSTQYQTARGHIEIGGIQYEYCKRRIFNDSLEVLCIPNQAVTKIKMAGADFFKLVNNLHTGQEKKQGQSQNSSKHFTGDDYTPAPALTTGIIFSCNTGRSLTRPSYYISTCLLTDDQPPESHYSLC